MLDSTAIEVLTGPAIDGLRNSIGDYRNARESLSVAMTRAFATVLVLNAAETPKTASKLIGERVPDAKVSTANAMRSWHVKFYDETAHVAALRSQFGNVGEMSVEAFLAAMDNYVASVNVRAWYDADRKAERAAVQAVKAAKKATVPVADQPQEAEPETDEQRADRETRAAKAEAKARLESVASAAVSAMGCIDTLRALASGDDLEAAVAATEALSAIVAALLAVPTPLASETEEREDIAA